MKDQGVEEDGVEILIVEDSPTQAEELRYTLARHSFAATIAGNGVEALSMIRKRKPTMVISDIVMPEMDGYQLCREIKNDDSLKDLHVILLTSLSDPRDVIRGLECGTDNFITKPYDEKYIISRIHYILANMHLRDVEQTQLGVEVILAGERYFIKTDRIQILNLLLSSYEAAIQKNIELTMARDEMRSLSGQLEQKVKERTAELSEEIMERKRTEAALIDAKEEWERTFDAITDPLMVVDTNYRIKRANRGMADKLGISRTSVEGLTCFKAVHGIDDPPSYCPYTRLLADGHPHSTEIHDERLGGDFLISVSPLTANDGRLLGSVHYIRDITERKLAERSLKESEEKFRSLSETAANAIIMIDNEGDIAYWNPAAERIFGYADHEVMGKSLHLLLAPERYHDLYRKGFARYRETGEGPAIGKTLEMEAVKKDGTEIPVEVSFSIMLINAKRYAIGIIRDISERKMAECERIRLEEQLRQAQKMEAIGQLSGGIAHDFNNILMAIIGFSNILKMKLAEQDPLQADIDQILVASDRAAHLTQSMLAYSRKQIMAPKTVDLNDIVRNGEKFLRKVIGKDVDFISSFSDGPLQIFADSMQIEQVLMNLAANARDAMPDGGTLFISITRVEIDDRFVGLYDFAKRGMYALLSFSDTGVGMDETTTKRIFDPFFTTKEIGKGTGLGLSMVYGIVRQHGGFITCYSEPGKGTTFRIYLPISHGEVGDGPPLQDIQMIQGRETILLAEDDPASRSMSRHYLEKFGYSVIEATDGEEAVRKFIEQREKIDLALIDVIMPRVSGGEVYRRIKVIKPDVKVIFMSGYTADIIHKEEIVEEGLTVLTKPTMLRELPIKIREVLDS